jgi:phosphate acetyltransferase
MAESRKHEKYDALIYSCCALAPVRTAVAHPCDEPSLASALGAARAKIIKPILVGPEAKIRALAASRSLDLAGLQLVDTTLLQGSVFGGRGVTGIGGRPGS